MIRNPFVAVVSPGRMHLALRTRAANDNVPLDATSPPRRADGNASTRWPLLPAAANPGQAAKRAPIAKLAAFPAPSRGLGVEAGKARGACL